MPPATTTETILLGPDLSALATTVAGAVGVDAAGATAALLLVETPGGSSLGRVDVTNARFTVDLTRPVATPLPETGPVLLPRQVTVTKEDFTAWTALAITLTCADLLGAMAGAVQLACNYAKERRQYGQPIGAFQAVQHLLADAHVATEGARSVTRHAAWSVDALGADDALAAASLAKAYCARAARAACETSIQVHGGIGNTWDCLAHVYLRRALTSIDMFGGVGINLTRVLIHHKVGEPHGLR
jgi:hypothetical protein